MGDGFGDFVKRIIDVSSEVVGVEDDIQLLVGDGAAAVAEGCGGGEGHGVRGTDGVEFVCASFTMRISVALELVDGAICVAVHVSASIDESGEDERI